LIVGDKMMNIQRTARLGLVAFLLVAAPALAAVAPVFTTDGPFAIVSDTYTNTVAGTTITGNICFTTGPAVAPVVSGTSGPCPAGTGADQVSATATLTSQACVTIAGPMEAVIIGANPPGTFPPGCYTSVGALNISVNGIVTLNGNGVYVFRSTGGAITTGANSSIVLAGGACADSVFWTAVGLTTLGGASSFVGSILDAAGITMGLASTLNGRALAFGGTVTTNGGNTIGVPAACVVAAGGGGAGIPTLSEWAKVLLAALLAIAGFAAMRKRLG
jgi:Ice-binding-like/IPTL-CTERM motif